jgi:hypothetical protein
MNRPFRPVSKLSSAVILSGIGGLAEHYGSQAQVATTATTAPRA